ncbi:MAG: DUF1156 domain-containing protein [Gemmatimonadetes bacterium]|nr:DUF1156 domain-containing protein [Gemmatimonadota bacterium]MYB98181.1 DUF1156 domain-containing protein [Gemmatimonadota bacterium]MYI44998.1 DUF1156 domain-containing protein [Gemmatimonadota bacterium]
MSIEQRFDVPFVAALALREKAIQQNYRPIIAVHKWFARRPGTLFRALMLSEFVDAKLSQSYFSSHQLQQKVVADPFMGGGTPLIEANRLGADVIGWDINPMAWWIVGRELEDLDSTAYRTAALELVETLQRQIGHQYETECAKCSGSAEVKYFLWVKTQPCRSCRRDIDLFPGYLVAKGVRHPKHVLACAECGRLNEVTRLGSPGHCSACTSSLVVEGPARRGSVECAACGTKNRFPCIENGPLSHRMFAIEYHCPECKRSHKGRFFKEPSADDLAKYAEADEALANMRLKYVPEDRIPPGDESSRLHRWGYEKYRQMFNSRQLLGLELSCGLIAAQADARVRRALATNLSDLLRYNNLLVRYDTMALKALDLFSVHGFPVGLVRCEANLLGILGGNGKPVGSGGWVNMIAKYSTAKDFCVRPFEVPAGRRKRVYTRGEWIGDRSVGNGKRPRRVDLRCGSATEAELKPGSLDAVLTDPPYYDSVQYAELMDFCYIWLRRLVGEETEAFAVKSTRNRDELTGNATEGRDLEHFTDGLATVYARMTTALKPGAPLVFTYHHNRRCAYHAVAVAILDAGLMVTAAIPCPAEMSGSIHISGTKSAIVDTVFVCRSERDVSDTNSIGESDCLEELLESDLAKLRAAGMKPRSGDIRCLALGHVTRQVVARLRTSWDRTMSTRAKIDRVAESMDEVADIDPVAERVLSGRTVRAWHTQQELFEDALA